MSTTSERIELLITASSQGAVKGIKETESALGGLKGATQGANDQLSKMSGGIIPNIGSAMKTALPLAAAAGAAALAKFAVDGVNNFVNLASEVRNFGRVSGASAEESSKIVAVLDDMEVSSEAGGKAMFKLGTNVADGGAKLQAFGVEVAKNKDGTTDLVGTLLNVADAYKSTGDQGERNALVMEAFGRSGKELIPILEQGRKGLEKFFASAENNHQILSQEDLDMAREYELAIDALNDAMGGLQRSAGSALVPVITDLANTTAMSITEIDQLTGSVGGLTGVLGFANEAFNPLQMGLSAATGAAKILSGDFRDGAQEMTGMFGIVGMGVSKLGELTGVFNSGGAEIDKFTASQGRLQEAQQNVAKVFADSTSSVKDRKEAQRELNAAENESEAIIGRVSAALQTNGSRLAENAVAAQGLVNATLGVQGAQLNVEVATQKYSESLFINGAEHLTTRSAALQLEGQYVNLGVATYNASQQAGDSVKESSKKQIEALSFVAGTLDPGSPLRVFLDGYIDQLRNGIPDGKETTVTANVDQALWAIGLVKSALNGVNGAVASVGGWLDGERAAGGPVNAGGLYLVGERGPELFAPSQSGTIIPNASAGGTAFGDVQIYITSDQPPGAIAREVRANLMTIGAL